MISSINDIISIIGACVLRNWNNSWSLGVKWRLQQPTTAGFYFFLLTNCFGLDLGFLGVQGLATPVLDSTTGPLDFFDGVPVTADL